CKLLYEHGDADWFRHVQTRAAPAPAAVTHRPSEITFRTAETSRPRGLQHVAPSKREGQARVHLDRLFNRTDTMGAVAGTVCHAWFAEIGWLEDGMPSDDALRA